MLPICIMTIEDESDREFMARLYTRYRRLMYDTIRQVVGDHWSAEDVVQATLLKLIDKVPKLQTLDDRRTAGYIAAACRHTAYNELRRRSRQPLFVPEEERTADSAASSPRSMELHMIRKEDLRRMAEIWGKLDERSRFALEARYILEQTDAEIAQSLSISPESVRMVLTRARQKAFALMDAAAKQ